MIARLIKVVAAFLAFGAVALAGLSLWSEYQARQYEAAVADAEAWNRAHWESGTAYRVTARMTYRYLGEEGTQDRVLHCFQKRMVGRGNTRRPRTYTVSRSTFQKSLIGKRTENRVIYVGPSGRFCTRLFKDGPPASMPVHFSGDVVINEVPTEDTTTLYLLNQRLGPACRIPWTTGQPIDLGDGLRLDKAEILSVEDVAMSSALAKPEYLGPADAILERLVETFSSGGNPDKPARFEWSAPEKCWTRNGAGPCVPEADDLCGIPRL